MTGTREGCSGVAPLKVGLVQRGELADVRPRDLRTRCERRIVRRMRKTHVPGTDVLTDVAAEHPVADLRGLRVGELPAMLDREIGNARARVEIAFSDERLGGARIEAAAARAAAVRLEWKIRLEIRITQHNADERERSDFGMYQHHVLADPSEPGELGQLSLGHGARVDVTARRCAGHELADGRRELLEPVAEDVMVIRGPRVLRHLAPRRGRGARYPGPMEVVRERHNSGLRAGHHQTRIFPLFRLSMQIRHRAGVCGRAPTVQFGRMRIWLWAG